MNILYLLYLGERKYLDRLLLGIPRNDGLNACDNDIKSDKESNYEN